MTKTRTRTFKTETKQLLQLMIHSLYSNKEIFLRELVSNASDALDKLRFKKVEDSSIKSNNPEISIHINTEENKITISDSGIGMTEEEIVENIGTIARSGTANFLSNISGDAKKDSQLIGQFGVGFYSVFMVAEHVTLSTRKAGSDSKDGVIWASDGQGEYTLETADIEQRGTSITLKLKKQEKEFKFHKSIVLWIVLV